MPSNPVHDFFEHDNSEMTKEAIDWGKAKPVGKGLASVLGFGVAAPLTLMAGMEGYDAIKGAVQKSRGYKRMIDYDPELKRMDAKKVRAMYDTIHNVAPTLARDPLSSSGVIKKMVAYGDYVDPKTLSELAGAEQRMHRTMSPFRAQMISSVSGEMMGAVSPLMQAKLEESRASAALKEKELSQLDERLNLQRRSLDQQAMGHQLKEEEHELRTGQWMAERGIGGPGDMTGFRAQQEIRGKAQFAEDLDKLKHYEGPGKATGKY